MNYLHNPSSHNIISTTQTPLPHQTTALTTVTHQGLNLTFLTLIPTFTTRPPRSEPAHQSRNKDPPSLVNQPSSNNTLRWPDCTIKASNTCRVTANASNIATTYPATNTTTTDRLQLNHLDFNRSSPTDRHINGGDCDFKDRTSTTPTH